MEVKKTLTIEFKAGQTFQASIPFGIGSNPRKVHICYVLDSVYENNKLIIYKFYGKHKQWWHEIMCTESDMKHYIKMAETS